MPVVNVRMTNINGNRKEDLNPEGNIEIKSNFKIDSVKKEKDDNGQEFLRVAFTFDVNYKPNVGDMEVKGFLWYKAPDLKKAAKEKDGKVVLQPDVIKEVSTVILRESLLESAALARKIRLPIPIRLPEVTAEVQSTSFPSGS